MLRNNDNHCKVKSLVSSCFLAFGLVSETPRTESGVQADSPPPPSSSGRTE
jgi:hypothetical protein